MSLQLVLRDAHDYRVRAAAIRVAVSPQRSASVRPRRPVTLDPGVVPIDLAPHGLLPKSFRLTLTVVDATGRAVARHVFGCRDLDLARRRGC